jgi:hypothetical protein
MPRLSRENRRKGTFYLRDLALPPAGLRDGLGASPLGGFRLALFGFGPAFGRALRWTGRFEVFVRPGLATALFTTGARCTRVNRIWSPTGW